MSGPQIWLCLFTFRPIASKQLNGLTTIDIYSWLGGAVVTHPLWVQEVRVQSPSPARRECLIFVLFCCCCVFTFFVKKHIICHKSLQFLYNIYLFSIHKILQALWPIIRVKRYRPSIFKWKQLKSLTTIVFFSWLGGAEVLHPLWVREVPGSIPGSCTGLYVCFFVWLCFYFFVKKKPHTIFVAKFCNFFCNVHLFSILNIYNILQDVWPIIRV